MPTNSIEPQGSPEEIAPYGSGAILPEVIKAQEVLESKYGVGADVWGRRLALPGSARALPGCG